MVRLVIGLAVAAEGFTSYVWLEAGVTGQPGMPTEPRYFGGIRNVRSAVEPPGDQIRRFARSRDRPWPTQRRLVEAVERQ